MGQETEAGRGAGQVIHREGEWRDAETGCCSSRSVTYGRALLVGATRWRAAALDLDRGRRCRCHWRSERRSHMGWRTERRLTGIAGELGRSVSTVSWGVARNVGPNGYRAARADRLATTRTARPRAES